MTRMVGERTAQKRAREGGWAHWIKGPADLRAARRGCWFDQGAADRVVRAFEQVFVHPKGIHADEPFKLLDFQRDFLSRLFGWRRPDASRRFRKALLALPRRAGKTTIISGVALHMLLGDDERAGEVYITASAQHQAAHCFRAAHQMIMASPILQEMVQQRTLEVLKGTYTIYDHTSMSALRLLTPDSYRSLGINPSCIVVDELVAQPNRDLIDALNFAPGSRRQPLTLYVTTAGHDITSICYEVWQHAEGVESGDIDDDAFLPCIFSAPPDEPWDDIETAKRCNPGIGHTIGESFIVEEIANARTSNLRRASYEVFRLNRWVAAAGAFLDTEDWRKCSTRGKNETYEQWRERILKQAETEQWRTWVGCDLGAGNDLSSVALLFRHDDEDGPRYTVVQNSWLPEDNLRPHERPSINQIADAGFVTITPGNATDIALIADHVKRQQARFNVQEFCYDPAFNGGLPQMLLGHVELTSVPTNAANLNDALRGLERLVLLGRIDAGGDMLLAWCVSHMEVATDGGDRIKPCRPRTAKKIDPVVATVTALARAMTVDLMPILTSVDDFYFT